MEIFAHIPEIVLWLLPLIIFLAIWELVWKLVALWKSARNGDKAWFVCIALFNTVAILPIIYLLMTRDKEEKNTFS